MDNLRAKIVLENYTYGINSSLGLLAVAFKTFFPKEVPKYGNISRWKKAVDVARELNTNPLEILVLDTPTAMLPEKRKELIENPESLFGPNYQNFLEFADTVTKDNGKALRIDPKIFTPELLNGLSISGTTDNSLRQVLEEIAQSDLRNNLPHLMTTDGSRYDPKNALNIYYEEVAEKTKDGILAAFEELADNSLPDKDDEYKKRVALLGGLTALEVLFTDKNAEYASFSTFYNALFPKS
ncbi:MAG: hypothetical protein AAB437_02630 [Patescibacteria group bacterium]